MKEVKSICLLILSFIAGIALTYVLFLVIRYEYNALNEEEIESFGDLLSYIIGWIIYLCSYFNIILYMLWGVVWVSAWNYYKDLNGENSSSLDNRDYYSNTLNETRIKGDDFINDSFFEDEHDYIDDFFFGEENDSRDDYIDD